MAHNALLLMRLIALVSACLPSSLGYWRTYYNQAYYHPNAVTQQSEQTIYANFAPHCWSDPEYTIKPSERYVIRGSLPVEFDPSLALIGSDGNLLSSLLIWNCSFTLLAPIGRVLVGAFSDKNCNNWPVGCSLTVYNGNFSSDNNSSVLLALNSSSTTDNNCNQQFVSSSNAIYVQVTACDPNPSDAFNFTLTVAIKSDQTNNNALQYVYIVLSAFSAIVSALSLCMRLVNQMNSQDRCYCRQQLNAVSPELPPSSRPRLLTVSEVITAQSVDRNHRLERSEILVPRNGQLEKYEIDENGELHLISVTEPPPYYPGERDISSPPPSYALVSLSTNVVTPSATSADND